MTTPSGTQWTIASGAYEATVVEVGGGLRRLTWQGEDLVHGWPNERMADAARGQLLAPWPNRTRDGAYTVNGERYQLPLSEPATHNANHGLVNWLPWSLLERSESALRVGVTLHPQPGWAWTLRLEVSYTLDEGGLTVTPCVTNHSSTAAPFGFGAHPYLTAGERTLDEARVQAPVVARIVTDERMLPVGKADETYGLADGVPLAGLELDTGFTVAVPEAPTPTSGPPPADRGAWQATLVGPARSTTLWADAAFGYVQLFTGDALPDGQARASGLAVEPMTCPADALNSGEGLLYLEPHEPWSAPFGITASGG